jgi:hypothetical protein
MLGPFLDETDGKTAETALSIANTDIKIWKSGATSEVNKNSGGATHIAAGRYYAVLDATDTDTLGSGEINVHVAGALPIRREFLVLPANIHDSFVLGTDILQVDVTQFGGANGTFSGGRPEVNTSHWGGTAIASALVRANVIQWTGTNVTTPDVAGSPKVTLTSGTGAGLISLSSGLVTLAASQPGVTIPTVTTLTNAPSDSSGVTTLLGRLTSARAGYLDNLNGSTLPDIETGVSSLLTRLTATRAGYLDYLDRINGAMELDGAVYRFTTNALENAPTGSGSAPEVIAEAVWDFQTASANEAGSFGEFVQDISGGGGSAPTAEEVVAALFADTSVEDGIAFRGIIRAILAATAGVSPAPIGMTRLFKNPAGTITRITATVPGDGSRTAIVLSV